jgi:ketosteroid isomerase-like protein
MNRIFTLLLMLSILNISGYSQAESIQQQINQQVWKPFIQSFNNLDTKGFMTVHSTEMTRVLLDGNTIYGYDRYYKETDQGNESTKKSNRKRTLELRFIQRIAADAEAFEVGYYKFTGMQPDGTTRHGYGKFHVLLHKENGTWKILMDADASEKTDEAIFLSAKPM